MRLTQNNVHSFQHKLCNSGLPPCRTSNNFCWAIQAQGKSNPLWKNKGSLSPGLSGEAGHSTSGQAWSSEGCQVGCPEHDKAKEGPNKSQSMRNRSAVKIIKKHKAHLQSLASELVWHTTRPNGRVRGRKSMVRVWNPLSQLVISKQVQRPSAGFTGRHSKKGLSFSNRLCTWPCWNDSEEVYLGAEGWTRWTYEVMLFLVKQAVLMRLVPVMRKNPLVRE